jgi:translation initiation factor 1 (eIF-1/SUI1)
MSKSKVQPSTKKAPVSPKATLIADPIGMLGAQVAKAIAKELIRLAKAEPPRRSKKATVGLIAGIEPKELEARLSEVAGKALVRELSSKTAKGTTLRMSLIVSLAQGELAAEAEVRP